MKIWPEGLNSRIEQAEESAKIGELSLFSLQNTHTHTLTHEKKKEKLTEPKNLWEIIPCTNIYIMRL